MRIALFIWLVVLVVSLGGLLGIIIARGKDAIKWFSLLAYAIFVVRDDRLTRLVWRWPWLSADSIAEVELIIKEYEEGFRDGR